MSGDKYFDDAANAVIREYRERHGLDAGWDHGITWGRDGMTFWVEVDGFRTEVGTDPDDEAVEQAILDCLPDETPTADYF